ncbi:hypothetical protein TraAM80_06102 [Trypanosoma rangeli]|uniref:Uncharacterized protein n=1 Tax=Trypanosoma rangeli TaxID=5698 RepID=A0A3R7MBM6_TRYRA|nr:uncharacterized protein TraAM80_06102 [Trypanosoma rangeli]RNF02899.1 hypothetical protein TraAM80_06102 [Trypanosoma rangeli]|eukprot:RNF02899.1 hypothetical protein TraAM80_06102 [Trypanosoma rangeli]
MTELGEVLACRLVAEDERLRRQHKVFEEQRQWLLARLVSVSHSGGGSVGSEKDEVGSERRQERRPLQSHSSCCTGGVPVEDRLLEYGRRRDERVERARRTRQEAAEMADRKLLERAEPSTRSGTRAALSSSAQAVALRRAARHERLVEESIAELNFHPRISIESARLAQERRVKENTESLSVSEVLLRRQAMTDAQLERKRAELNAIRAAPMITKKAKTLSLPYTASERLYLHAKERQDEDKEVRERLHEMNEKNLDYSFHPSISEKAEQLHRKPGRRAYEDLYEHGMQQQHQRRLETSEANADFRPNINRVSKLIEARMCESTTERLLKPRQTKRAETPSARLRLRREDLDRRFEQLYVDGGARVRRRRSFSEGEHELEPECTFAPKINRGRIPADGVSGLPLDVRMHLWQERKNQKLMLIRLEAQKMEEEEYRGMPISPWQGDRFQTERDIRCRPRVASGDATAPTRESHSSSCRGAATAAARPVGHEETMLKALQALEHAERVSQYIMID